MSQWHLVSSRLSGVPGVVVLPGLDRGCQIPFG
jgi:hypothetical protein